MKAWLKVVCILLLLYTAVFGFIHPLIPGGLDVRTESLHPGENELEFVGYNTSFLKEQNQLQLFVAVDSAYYCTTILSVSDDTHARVSVILPDTLPSLNFSFYANTPSDGTVYVKKALGQSGFATNASARGTCKPSVSGDEHQGFGFPFQIILFETIRNLMWHVPMWFTMFTLMLFSLVLSIRSLNSSGQSGTLESYRSFTMLRYDRKASIYASSGLVFCTLGLITGSIWARFTWGDWWTNDPQLNGAMVVFIVYVAYFILRSSVPDEEKRARLSAIFNIFAAVLMIILLMVMPRFAEGLHPGKSGNPAFSQYDLDSSLRAVFYPAVLGWILLGYWLYSVHYRLKNLEDPLEDETTSAS